MTKLEKIKELVNTVAERCVCDRKYCTKCQAKWAFEDASRTVVSVLIDVIEKQREALNSISNNYADYELSEMTHEAQTAFITLTETDKLLENIEL